MHDRLNAWKMKLIGIILRFRHHFTMGLYICLSQPIEQSDNFSNGVRVVQHRIPILQIELRRQAKSILNVPFAPNLRTMSPALCS